MAKGNTIRKERRGRVPVNASRPRTRGQRGKLHDPATNTAELTAQLRAMGLYAAPTLGDGNCLFRALSDQMYGTADKHLPLRQEICAYMAAHKSRFEAFVDDDRSWDQHISTMCKSGTYGGHLELTAFAQLKVVNVKVVQPGLVYVIEGSKTEVGGASGCAAGASAVVGEEMSSKERRKARKERMKKKSEEKDDDDDDDDDYGGSDPFPATVYVAYHDWEHFSSVRNLTGPHTGPPNVCEVPEPETSSLPSPPPSKPAKSSRKQPTTQQPTPESSSPSPPPPSRSPKRAIDEEDEEEEEGRKRGRRGTITRHVLEDDDDDGEAAESTGVSASAESFISDAPPPPPPEPEPEPEKLTKRQRKSLGVPKPKAARASVGKTRAKAPVSAKSTKAATASKAKSDSTPTTPAKRETRSATKAYRDAGKVRDLGTGEWLDNGTGRLDVRGFRELRI